MNHVFESRASRAAHLDPITAEIIRGNFVAITDEMKSNLMRTAYNQIIYEAQDFTVGLFDPRGDTISIGLGLPMFVGGLSRAVKAMISHYGPGGLEPGDILLTNDAYIMGSHLNHMIFALPIFADGEVVAFASAMAHWLDVGGTLSGVTTDIYSEGLQVPIVKIFKKGVQDEELTRLIEMNVRFSDLALGDLRAQVAAVRTGESRMNGLIQRHGAAVIADAITQMFDRSEALARAAVRDIVDGEYFADTKMDDDGVTVASVPLKVRVVVEGDRMIIDLSMLSPAVAGFFNSGETAGRSAAQVAFKALTSPSIFPINEGSLRPVEIILPPGSVMSAQKPAPMRWWMTYPMTVVDLILKAVSSGTPSGGIAGHHADLAIAQVNGFDHQTGRPFFFIPGPQGGGWGATRDKDGESATICINDGDTHNVPIEVTESKVPSTLGLRYALVEDSGGAGRTRGGLGTVQEWAIYSPGHLSSAIERTQTAAWGVAGGLAALPNRITVRQPGEGETTFHNGKISAMLLSPGVRVTVVTGGGGGYGNPHDRSPALVLDDVQAGYVSPSAARVDYGVALTVDGEGTRKVDAAATDRLRASRGHAPGFHTQ